MSDITPAYTEADLERASKKNIFGLATVGFACCGGTVSVAAILNIPILGAIIGGFGLTILVVRFLNVFRKNTVSL